MVAKLQHGGRAGLDAQLVFDADAVHIVARTERTIGANHEFGYDKQADALDAFGRAGHAGQHQMDDVLGHVVFTPGDVDFGTKNFVRTVRLRLGAGAHSGKVAASLWLGQVHRASPLAADQLRQIGGF